MEPNQVQAFASVFHIAIDKFAERSRQYEGDDPWGNGGYRAQLVEMRKKLDRLWTHWDGEKGFNLIEDDAIDLITYTAFFIILAERGDRDGSWPWREREATEGTVGAEPISGQDSEPQGTINPEEARRAWEQVGDALRQLASS